MENIRIRKTGFSTSATSGKNTQRALNIIYETLCLPFTLSACLGFFDLSACLGFSVQKNPRQALKIPAQPVNVGKGNDIDLILPSR